MQGRERGKERGDSECWGQLSVSRGKRNRDGLMVLCLDLLDDEEGLGGEEG